MRNTALKVVFIIVLTLSLGILSIAAQEGEITLVVYGEPGPDCEDPNNAWEFCLYSRSVTELWYEQHPNIRIEWVNAGWDAELYSALNEAIDEGNPPDITIGETFLPLMMRDGLLLPLDLDEEIHENIVPGTVAYVTDEEGILYGVPIFTGVFAWEINPDVFYTAGLLPETTDLTTWDAVLDASTTITDTGGSIYYGNTILGPTNLPAAALFRFAPYYYMTGADFCNMPACDEPTLNDPLGVAAYEFFRELVQSAPEEIVFNGEEGYVLSQLFNGTTAMQTAGSWHIAWAAGSGCVDCRYLPLPLPTENTEATNVVVGNAIYSILASTEHPEEAKMFLEFLASDEIQTRVLWTGVGGRLPATYSALQMVLDVSEGDSLDNLPAFWSIELSREPEDAITFASDYIPFVHQLMETDLRTLPFWSTDMNILWNELFLEVLQTDRPIEEILDDYQVRAEQIMHASDE
ncbi:MAG: ABC transporter substrate-binding protein [Chloroflexota bacterium]